MQVAGWTRPRTLREREADRLRDRLVASERQFSIQWQPTCILDTDTLMRYGAFVFGQLRPRLRTYPSGSA